MPSSLPPEVASGLQRLVRAIVDDKLEASKDYSAKGSISPDDVRTVLVDAGITPGMPPQAYWDQVDVYPVEDIKDAWAIDVDIWDAAGKQTDLTLQLAAFRDGGAVRFEIWDLHAL